MLVELLAALSSLLAGGSWAAWRASPGTRAARAAARAVQRVGEVRAPLQAAREASEQALREEGGRWAERWREVRRGELSVETLKAHGARRVRWQALHDAGHGTLADVTGKPAKQLAALPGIGPLTARRVAAAARRADGALQQEPVPPPRRLDEPGAEALVRQGLVALETRAALGDVPRRLAAQHDELVARLAEVRRQAAFLRWVFGSAASDDRRARLAAARALEGEARALLDGGLAAEAQQRLHDLAARPAPDARALRQAWEQRYAEVCAVLDAALGPGSVELPPVDTEAGARLPDEIVARVASQPLHVEALSVPLRRYQEFGARFVLAQERTVLGDDMGLGKTLQALAALVHLDATGEGRRFLVVAPATVVPHWAREIEDRTPLACHVLHGSRKEAALARWLLEGGVALTSYATLRRLALRPLLPATIDLLVADEAHYLKNPAASRTAAVAELLEVSRRACLMTGTPLENDLGEFAGLVRLLRRDLLPADGEPDEHGVFDDPRAFAAAVATCYLRRNQQDVLHELPACIEMDEWVDLRPAEAQAYADAVAAGNVMAMRRATTVGDWDSERLSRPHTAKLDRIAELVDEHRQAGRKVLVFTFFLDVLAALQRRIPVLGAIHGGVPSDERERLIAAFTAAQGHAVLLGQVTAAGVGLNLQAASVVVLVEPQWKPSTEEQAVARAHRMGQREVVVVHRLLARDSVDERIVELLAGKQELFERFARPSAVKAAAKDATEARLSKLVVSAEQGRLAHEGRIARAREAERETESEAPREAPREAEIDAASPAEREASREAPR